MTEYVKPELEVRVRERLMQLRDLLERAQDAGDTEPRFDPDELVIALGKQLNLHPARKWKDGSIDCETCSIAADYPVRWPCQDVETIAEAMGVDTGSKRRL